MEPIYIKPNSTANGVMFNPEFFPLNLDKIKTLEDVIAILASLDLKYAQEYAERFGVWEYFKPDTIINETPNK